MKTIDSMSVKFPPGSRVRERRTGGLYVVGIEARERAYRGHIWIMSLDPAEREAVLPSALSRDFEPVLELVAGTGNRGAA
jgi:hypothetical protein